jgi:hypothetical protein
MTYKTKRHKVTKKEYEWYSEGLWDGRMGNKPKLSKSNVKESQRKGLSNLSN